MTTARITDTVIAHLVDDTAVRDHILRFADIATRGDLDAFPGLWAPDATWVIGGTEGQPFERRAQGVDDITALYRRLREERDHFIQFVQPNVVEIDGDTATARSNCQESAQGNGQYYRTSGIWTDTFRRTGDGWVFTERRYEYLWLDFSPYTGEVSWS